MFTAVNDWSTRLPCDTLVDADEEPTTAKVPLYAQNLARQSAGLPVLSVLVPVSGTHEVIPPPKRVRALAVPAYESDDDAVIDDEPTNRQPDFVRHLADSILAEYELANGVSGEIPVLPDLIKEPEQPKAVEQAPALAALEDEDPPNLDDILHPPVLPTARRMPFYWAASVAAVVGACALTAGLLRSPHAQRSPHAFVPALACLADATRPAVAPEVSSPVVRRQLPASRAASKRTPPVRRPAVVVPHDDGIVRDLPF
jgi:hypothetical protein